MENTDMIEQVIRDGWTWVVSTYQTEGPVGLIVTLVAGGVIFGGMGAVFYLAAKANAKGMKKDDK